MNKLIKLFALFTIVLSMLTIGCGPSKEEQYNTLKQETLKMAQEIPELFKKPKEIKTKMNFDRSVTPHEATETNVKNFKEANNKAIEKMPAIEKNVAKMKELTKDNVKLTNDLNETIKTIKYMTYEEIDSHNMSHWNGGKLPEGYTKLPDDWKTIEPKF